MAEASGAWGLAKRVVFQLDAETVHRVAVQGLKFLPLFRPEPRTLTPEEAMRLPMVLGMPFRSRVGLAAGFDKDAEVLRALPLLGFGFAEIGTVTPRPQPGNDKPRLFRDPSRRAIFNRMGFNGKGAIAVARNLAHAKPLLPAYFRVGVNLGKNKDTPLELAARDYADAARSFDGLADYLVINVSSPNTPGLRSLQTVEALEPIVGRVNEVISSWSRRPPLLLKLAPELQEQELGALVSAAEAWGVDGWVLTNTLSGTWRWKGRELPGGWSGLPLAEHSRERLVQMRRLTRRPIVSVGGIMDAQEARRRVETGAELVQVYSGWIYAGPAFPRELEAALSE